MKIEIYYYELPFLENNEIFSKRCSTMLKEKILAEIYGISNLKQEIFYTSKGKGLLPKQVIHFSMSHSGKYIFLAVAPENIGIDIQLKDEANINIFDIADLFFSEAQAVTLKSSENPLEDFFKIWSAKEALVKYLGLSFDEIKDFIIDFDSYLVFFDGEKYNLYNDKIFNEYILAIIAQNNISSIKFNRISRL